MRSPESSIFNIQCSICNILLHHHLLAVDDVEALRGLQLLAGEGVDAFGSFGLGSDVIAVCSGKKL